MKIITKNSLEKDVKANLRAICTKYGALPIHIPGSQLTRAGTPDYVILNKFGITIYVEAKSPKGKQSPAQILIEEEITKRHGFYLLYNGFNDEDLIKYLLYEPRNCYC